MKYTMIFLALISFQDTTAQDYVEEIKAIKGEEEITEYWKSIKELDQTYRGASSIDSIDNINFKKTILMIQHHGYPSDLPTPNLVFTHQRSTYVREYYFPIFHKAYKDGIANNFWFMHNVRGLHRGRFPMDFTQPDDANYLTVLKRIDTHLNTEVDYNLEPFDTLYSNYIIDVHRITETAPILQWKNEYSDTISFYKFNDKTYIQKVWRDGSYKMPLEITRNNLTNKYEYVKDAGAISMKINQEGKLLIYKGVNRPITLQPTTISSNKTP